MSSLREIQESLQHYILYADKNISQQIQNPPAGSQQDRLEIYRDAYYLRLLEILEKDYRVLLKILGGAQFETIGIDYISEFPSNSFSIIDVIKNLPFFLRTYPLIEPAHAEIALFEWLLSETLNLPNANQITLETLAKIPIEQWANIQFRLHPSVKSTRFYSNAPVIWQSVDRSETLPETIYYQQAKVWLTWRFERSSHYMEISNTAEQVFLAIEAGKNFGEICEMLADLMAETEAAEFAAKLLGSWVASGIFAEIS